MNIKEIELHNFRCFTKHTYTIQAQCIIIQGPNGSGKTSLLEALYYAGHLRSWKTPTPREIINFNASSFYIRLSLTQGSQDRTKEQEYQELSIGFCPQKKVITLDQTPIRSFKDLYTLYKVIQITHDDVAIIHGAPEWRRTFIDTALLIKLPEYASCIKRYTAIVEQRNALLKQAQYSTLDMAAYWQWTEQLWYAGQALLTKRIDYIALLTEHVTELADAYGLFSNDPLFKTMSIVYEPKRTWEISFEQFKQTNATLMQEEMRIGRSLVGPHLDDIGLYCNGVKARIFASRGQQKFMLFLIKIAQIRELLKNGHRPVVLIDDFITDFDETKIETCLTLLKELNIQLFFTVPYINTQKEGSLENKTINAIMDVLGSSAQCITMELL